MSADKINPDHYKSETSLECIDAMSIIFGEDLVIDFCVGNAWKYIWRWKNKGGQEDLQKANWYINKAFEKIDNPHTLYPEEEKIRQILHNMCTYIERYLIAPKGDV